jgi:hypothetical protein
MMMARADVDLERRGRDHANSGYRAGDAQSRSDVPYGLHNGLLVWLYEITWNKRGRLHEWNLNSAFRLKGTNFGLKNFPNDGRLLLFLAAAC